MPVTKTRSKWSSGSLVFYEETSGIDLLTLDPLRQYEYDEVPTYTFNPSAEDASNFCFAIAPHSGTVVECRVVNHKITSGANIFTVFVSATSAGTITVASSTATGTVGSLTSLSAAIDEGGTVEFRSDGGAGLTMPVTCMAIIRR